MFIKRKTRAGKAYAYRLLLSFKTSVTYQKSSFNFTPGGSVHCSFEAGQKNNKSIGIKCSYSNTSCGFE